MHRILLCVVVFGFNLSAQSQLEDMMLAVDRAFLYPPSFRVAASAKDKATKYQMFDAAMQSLAAGAAVQMNNDGSVQNDYKYGNKTGQGTHVKEIYDFLKESVQLESADVQGFLKEHPGKIQDLTPYDMTSLLSLMFIADLKATSFPVVPTWDVVSKTDRVRQMVAVYSRSPEELLAYGDESKPVEDRIRAFRDRMIEFIDP